MQMMTREQALAQAKQINAKIIKTYLGYVNEFEDNEYLSEVFDSMTILYLANNYSDLGRYYKRTYFKEYKEPKLSNVLLRCVYPYQYEIPQSDINKANKIVKRYIDNFKKYN